MDLSLGFIDTGINLLVQALSFVKDLITNLVPGSENLILFVLAIVLTILFWRSEFYKKGGRNLMILVGAILFLLLKLL